MSVHKITLSLVAAAAASFAGAAYAADVYVPPMEPAIGVPAPEAWSWTGIYFGVHGGGGWSSADETTGLLFGDFPVSGPFVGGQIGANWQAGSFVLGIEGDYSWSGINGSKTVDLPAFDITTVSHEISSIATARGRVGFAWGKVLPYLTGGWAWATATRTSTWNAGGPGDGFATNTQQHQGWVAGGGVEVAFSEHVTGKLEYQYISLNGVEYDLEVVDPVVRFNVQTVRAGVNFLW